MSKDFISTVGALLKAYKEIKWIKDFWDWGGYAKDANAPTLFQYPESVTS